MIYYSLFLLIVYIVSTVRIRFGEKKDYKKNAAIIVGLAMLLIMGLRNQTIVGDTISYVANFQYRTISWSSFAEFLEQKEKLFYLFEMLLQKVTRNYSVYLTLVSVPIAVGFARLLKEYSDDMFLSILLFCGVGILNFCMAGLRQAMAIGCTMIAYPYAKNRKLIPFLLWCFIAYEFHNSAIVFVFVYLLINVKPDWKLWIAVIVCVILGINRSPIVVTITNSFTTKEYSMAKEGLNYTLFFIQLVFVVYCFVYNFICKRKGEDYSDSDPLLTLSFAGLCLQAFTPIIGEFFRASTYFSVYLCLEVTQTLSRMSNGRDKKLVRLIMIAGLLGYIYVFGGARLYIPFWG